MYSLELCLNINKFLSYAALAAASSPLGVVGGALAGHAVATLVSENLILPFGVIQSTTINAQQSLLSLEAPLGGY